MRDMTLKILRALGYNPSIYVISSEELDEIIGKDIEQYKASIGFALFKVRHREKYIEKYRNLAVAEEHYKSALKNMFEVILPQLMRKSIVVVPSYGLSQITLRPFIMEQVHKNHIVIFPRARAQLSNGSYVFEAQLGRDVRSVVLDQHLINPQSEVIVWSVLCMQLCKELHEQNQKEIEKIEQSIRVAGIASIIFITVWLARMIVNKFRAKRSHPSPVVKDSHAKVILQHVYEAEMRRKKMDMERELLKTVKEQKTSTRRNSNTADEHAYPVFFSQTTTKPSHTYRRKRSGSFKADNDEADGLLEAPRKLLQKVKESPKVDMQKITASLLLLDVYELDDLARFLSGDEDTKLRSFNQAQMEDFLRKFDCHAFKSRHNQHKRICLPDRVTISSMYSEQTGGVHTSGKIHKEFFDDLKKAFSSIGVNASFLQPIIEEKTEEFKRKASTLRY